MDISEKIQRVIYLVLAVGALFTLLVALCPSELVVTVLYAVLALPSMGYVCFLVWREAFRK